MNAPLPPVTINRWWCSGCGVVTDGIKFTHDSNVAGKQCPGKEMLLTYALTPGSRAALEAHRSR